MAKLSVVVPCYNEAKNIMAFYTSMLEVFTAIVCHHAHTNFELVFVNDGSKDETLLTLRNLENQISSSFAPPQLKFQSPLLISRVILAKKRRCMRGYKQAVGIA